MLEPNTANDLIVTIFGTIGLIFILPGLIVFYYRLIRSNKELHELRWPILISTSLLSIGYACWIIATISALTIETEFNNINYFWGILGIFPAVFFTGSIWFIKALLKAAKNG